jgi:small-conductance mechanosensitive channel
MRKHSTFLLFILNILFLSLPYPASAGPVENGTTPQTTDSSFQEPGKNIEEPQTSIIQFYTWAGILPKDFVDLQTKISADKTIHLAETELSPISEDIRILQWDVTMAKSKPNLQLMQIDSFQLKLNRLKGQVAKTAKPLNDNITKLSQWRKEWNLKKEKLAEFAQQENLVLAIPIEQKDILDKTIENSLQLIEKQLTPSLFLGRQIAELQVQLYTIENSLRTLDAEIRKASTQQTSPSILSADFYKRVNARLFSQAYNNAQRFMNRHIASLANNIRPTIFGIILLGALSLAISYTRSAVTASSRWYPFASCPFATAVFILTTTYTFIGMLPLSIKLEEKWEDLFSIMTILAVIRLTKQCIDIPWKRQLLNRLALFMAIIMFLFIIELPQLLILFFVFYASIVALMFFTYQLRYKCDNTFERWIRRSWGILPLLIILSGIMGYDQFAIYSFTILLSTVGAFLGIWMLYRLNSGLLEMALRALPFNLLHDNLSVIVKSLQPFIAWIHLLLLIAVLGVIWGLYPSVDTAIREISNLGFEIGTLHISPGFVLTVIFVLYGAILFSRAIQALLLREVLPRYKAEKGVQLSITRLVHYAILTTGFFIMLRVLGFELKQLTLLGGALGVGIGFGLQAIVNNFASGLILLFERPIKVGDTIQIGTEMGEVKNLGLRATVIQTFDNAEIVVPNSDLITGQVTNFTLADRRIRVRIPVGVAYGTDVSKVLTILKSCADLNPMVLSTPAPTALFLAFGASSLDFELRVWIPEFLDGVTVKSDLNQAIETEFDLNNIEIPFLQTDLHIRSVDDKAAEALRAKYTVQLQEEAEREIAE